MSHTVAQTHAVRQGFLSQTRLNFNQQRTNFLLLDNLAVELLSSAAAEKHCSKMLLVYVRLKKAETDFGDRSGKLRVIGNGEMGAWERLCEMAGVASATLKKCLDWMKEHRIIAYFAGKNGVGCTIYFNVAAESVKERREEKNLRLVPASSADARTSGNEAALLEDNTYSKVQNSNTDACARSAPAAATNDEVDRKNSAGENNQANSPSPVLKLVESSTHLAHKLDALDRKISTQLDRYEKRLVPQAVRVGVAEGIRAAEKKRKVASPDVGRQQPIAETAAYDQRFEVLDMLPPALYVELYAEAQKSAGDLLQQRAPEQADDLIRAFMIERLDARIAKKESEV